MSKRYVDIEAVEKIIKENGLDQMFFRSEEINILKDDNLIFEEELLSELSNLPTISIEQELTPETYYKLTKCKSCGSESTFLYTSCLDCEEDIVLADTHESFVDELKALKDGE